MEKKVFYVSPVLEELEIAQEGVLCSSDRNGGIDKLTVGPDWSEELWNNN